MVRIKKSILKKGKRVGEGKRKREKHGRKDARFQFDDNIQED